MQSPDDTVPAVTDPEYPAWVLHLRAEHLARRLGEIAKEVRALKQEAVAVEKCSAEVLAAARDTALRERGAS